MQQSLWVQGDVFRSKQKLQEQRQMRKEQLQQKRANEATDSQDHSLKDSPVSRLLDGMGDLSVNGLHKSCSYDEDSGLTQGDKLCALKGKRPLRSVSVSSRLNLTKADHSSILPPPKLKGPLPFSSSRAVRYPSANHIKRPFSLSLFSTRPTVIR